MPVNLTPAHLRCSLGGCPSVTRLDDGRLLIVGKDGDELAAITKSSDDPCLTEPWRPTYVADKVGSDEAVIVISPDLLAGLPEILHLRSQLATLKQALEPFAKVAEQVDYCRWENGQSELEDADHYDADCMPGVIVMGHLRSARAALTDEDKENG